MHKTLIISILILLSLSSFAQEQKEKKKKKVPKNIEAIDNKFSFSPIHISESSYLKIKSREYDEAMPIKYKPNVVASVGAKIRIKNVTIAYVHALPQSSDFGKTKSASLTFNLQRRVFGLKLYWSQYNGLYSDTLDRYSFLDERFNRSVDSSYSIRSDINLINAGFETHFVFMKSFSVKAALEQTERQKKTAGSVMLLLGANYMGLQRHNERSIIMPSQQGYYPRITDLNKLNVYALRLAPGIGYSFIMKKYFSLSAILLAGPSFQIKSYELDNRATNNFGAWVSFYYQGKVALGYNGRIFMANIIYSINQDVTGFNKSYDNREYDSKTNLVYFREYLRFSLGFRIL